MFFPLLLGLWSIPILTLREQDFLSTVQDVSMEPMKPKEKKTFLPEYSPFPENHAGKGVFQHENNRQVFPFSKTTLHLVPILMLHQRQFRSKQQSQSTVLTHCSKSFTASWPAISILCRCFDDIFTDVCTQVFFNFSKYFSVPLFYSLFFSYLFYQNPWM